MTTENLNRGLTRTWAVLSACWIIAILLRAYAFWPEDITWSDGWTSRGEVAFHSALLALIPVLLPLMVAWAVRGFRGELIAKEER